MREIIHKYLQNRKKNNSTSSKKEWLSTAESILKIIGIVVGVGWFILQGEALTKGNVTQKVAKFNYDDSFNLADVHISVKNCGKLASEINRIKICVFEVSPLLGNFKNGKNRRETVLGPYAVYRNYSTRKPVEWPKIITYNIQDYCEIRPGEDEELSYQFLIPKSKHIIKVETYVERGNSNSLSNWLKFPSEWQKRSKGMGWYAETVLDMQEAKSEKP